MNPNTPEPIPTRAALLQALKEDLESFEYLRGYFDARPDGIGKSVCVDCIDDAIARINDMLNVENARVMGEEKK